MRRIGIAAAVVLLGTGVVAAQQDLLSTRIELMKANAKSMYGNFNQMLKGAKPYDQATVDASLLQLEEGVKKLSALYPESTKDLKTDEDYAASSKIWDNKADFESHIAKLSKVIADTKGKINSLDDLKTAYPAINDQCGGCHETYRIKKS